MNSLRSLLAALIFLICATFLICFLYQRVLPKPLYQKHKLSLTTPYLEIGSSAPLVFKVKLPKFPERIVIPLKISGAPLEVEVLQTAPEDTTPPWRFRTRKTVLDSNHPHLIDLSTEGSVGGTLQITFSSAETDPEKMPRVFWSAIPTRYPSESLLGDSVRAEGGPILDLKFKWPEKHLSLLSLLVIPLALLAYHRRRFFVPFLLFMGLTGTLLSILLWQQNYTEYFGHWDADGYGHYATQLASWVTEPESRNLLSEWFTAYPQSHLFLYPFVLAPFVGAGIPAHFIYLLLNSLCSFTTLLIIFRIMRGNFGLPYKPAFLALLLFGSQLLFIRGFSRPVTDTFGLLLIVWSLFLLLERIKQPSLSNSIFLALVVFCHLISRPQGCAIVVFIGTALLAIDTLAGQGRRSLFYPFRNAILIFLPSLLVLAPLYLLFDLFHNFSLMMEKAETFRSASNLYFFVCSSIGIFQILPIYWMMNPKRLVSGPGLLLLSWLAFYVTMLIVVQAPFWPRHFIPLLPAIVLLAAMGLDKLVARAPKTALFSVSALALVNLALVLLQILSPDPIPAPLRHIISSS